MSRAFMQKFNVQKAAAALEKSGMSSREVSGRMGRCNNYVTSALKKGVMPPAALSVFCDLVGVSVDDLTKAPPSPSVSRPAYQAHGITLDVRKDKLRMALTFGDQELYAAWSRIKGDTELDLLQAVSYAAHLMYKLAEQQALRE